jgi:hypothetical protein
VGKGCAGYANEDDAERCRETTGARKAGDHEEHDQRNQGASYEVEDYGAHLRSIEIKRKSKWKSKGSDTID